MSASRYFTEHLLPLAEDASGKGKYGRFNALARAIVVELEAAEIPGNLATVDLFLCETGRRPILEKQVSVGEPIVEPDFDRDVVKEIVKNIGVLLGFDVQTEVNIAHDAVVDVVWRVGTDDPGEVTYAFEVHKAGPIDNLLVTLQKAMCRAMVQKVVTISDQ